jgi:hypothetical protein
MSSTSPPYNKQLSSKKSYSFIDESQIINNNLGYEISSSKNHNQIFSIEKSELKRSPSLKSIFRQSRQQQEKQDQHGIKNKRFQNIIFFENISYCFVCFSNFQIQNCNSCFFSYYLFHVIKF